MKPFYPIPSKMAKYQFMKHLLFLFFLTLSCIAIAQEEDPAIILSYDNKEALDAYMAQHHWRFDRKHIVDSLDGEFYLYEKKTSGHGVVYCSIHLKKYMHYQVFFNHKNTYSLVLDYDDFLQIPTGKSRFNESMENKVYAIKVVEFDDPADDRNKNLFFGKIKLDEHAHHKDAVVTKGSSKIKDYHTSKPQENEDQRREDTEQGGE